MNRRTVFAHSLPTGADTSGWETLPDHSERVGRRAGAFAESFGAGLLAFAAGLLHDIGKCEEAFQQYIRGERLKGPDHSTAGARLAIELFGQHIGRVLAFGIGGHHAGLMNGSGDGGQKRSLDARLSDSQLPVDWRGLIEELPSVEQLRATRPPLASRHCSGFEAAFLTRMLFSCLVDADFIETEAFYATAGSLPAPARGGELSPRHLELLCAYQAKHRGVDSTLNRLRNEILEHAVTKACLLPGLFTLTVPTGGGKTLTSLRFALEHAQQHGLRRVVYVIPFTSIIEQTAKVFREDLELGSAVLEHHSAFDWSRGEAPRSDEAREAADGLEKLRRDAENWDAPIVVTTAVQFFESLFSSRTSQVRKLHNLAKSVIILDEAQTLPIHLLRPCMAAMDELARNYGASIVLCTATQPALRTQDGVLPIEENGNDRHPIPGFDIGDERELAPRPRELYGGLKRVRVEWLTAPVDEVTIAARFAEQPQMLCIVNTRRSARSLFEKIAHLSGARHLTTLMYPAHRRVVLEELRTDLAAGRPVRLVATSLIEAGVDIDFPEVWREAAGLDSIAQAAGRCNREGRLERLGRVVVFEFIDRRPPPAIESFYQAARTVLRSGADPLSLESVYAYFRELYFQHGAARLDRATLDGRAYPILREIAEAARKIDFPFEDIARAFRLIDEAMVPVIVPRDVPAQDALEALRHAPIPPRDIQRLLQQYVVPLPRNRRAALLASGAVQVIRPESYGDRFVYLVSLSMYDELAGLRLDDPTWRSSEDNVV